MRVNMVAKNTNIYPSVYSEGGEVVFEDFQTGVKFTIITSDGKVMEAYVEGEEVKKGMKVLQGQLKRH
jgi:hypothetical protein